MLGQFVQAHPAVPAQDAESSRLTWGDAEGSNRVVGEVTDSASYRPERLGEGFVILVGHGNTVAGIAVAAS